MKIDHLALRQFRNYEELDIDLHPGTNLFYGENAQGKTNALEAVFLCGTTKSHRPAKEREMIRFGENQSHIRMELSRADVCYRVDLHLEKGKKKQYAINALPVKKAAQLLELGHYVFFSPEDLKIIKSGPAERRRFLDLQLCQLQPVYIHQLAGYNHVLSQRSALLREEPSSQVLDLLDVWDTQLVQFGRNVINAREKMVEHLNALVEEIHPRLTQKKEQVQVIYQGSVSAGGLEEELVRRRETDFRFHVTGVGPHRDDLMFLVDGKDLRKYGSQGQQRTAALSLKLAEIELAKRSSGDMPVLLLDDVFSELDQKRQRALLTQIRNTQTLITCTGMDLFRETGFEIDRAFHVSEGRMTAAEHTAGGLHG